MLVLLGPAILCAAGKPAPPAEFVFHGSIPLGADGIMVRDAGQTMYLLVSAANPQFEGWRRVVDHDHPKLLDASGSPVQSYPESVTFRVTASTRVRLLAIQQWPGTAGQDLEQYLLRLRFRLKVFRGLHQRVLQPESVTLVGMPADVAYDERVYRVNFRLGEVPVSDRLVFEVLSPKGDRLSRFHLDLQ
jgi:hypothetical protein